MQRCGAGVARSRGAAPISYEHARKVERDILRMPCDAGGRVSWVAYLASRYEKDIDTVRAQGGWAKRYAKSLAEALWGWAPALGDASHLVVCE